MLRPKRFSASAGRNQTRLFSESSSSLVAELPSVAGALCNFDARRRFCCGTLWLILRATESMTHELRMYQAQADADMLSARERAQCDQSNVALFDYITN